MNRVVAGYLAAAFVLVALDLVWLGVVATTTYQQGIGHLMAERPNAWAAAAFYLVYAAGLTVFVLLPPAGEAGWGPTLIRAALFGFVAYATYDLSNLATLKAWPLGLTFIDLAWGSALTTAAAAAGKAAMRAASPG